MKNHQNYSKNYLIISFHTIQKKSLLLFPFSHETKLAKQQVARLDEQTETTQRNIDFIHRIEVKSEAGMKSE